jgi:hypothetical protein
VETHFVAGTAVKCSSYLAEASGHMSLYTCSEFKQRICTVVYYYILVDGTISTAVRLEDLGTDGRIILKWILNKWNIRVCIGFSWLKIRSTVVLM